MCLNRQLFFMLLGLLCFLLSHQIFNTSLSEPPPPGYEAVRDVVPPYSAFSAQGMPEVTQQNSNRNRNRHGQRNRSKNRSRNRNRDRNRNNRKGGIPQCSVAQHSTQQHTAIQNDVKCLGLTYHQQERCPSSDVLGSFAIEQCSN